MTAPDRDSDLFANVLMPHARGKRRKMKSFQLDEISVVDKPAQEGATARIMKCARDTVMKGASMSAYDPPHVQRLHKAREARQADADEEDAAQRLRSLLSDADADEGDADEGDELYDRLGEGEEDGEEARFAGLAQTYGDADAEEEDTDLDAEVVATKQDADLDDEGEEFPDTPTGRIANGLMRRDPRMSKRRALLMAAGRRAAQAGTYSKRYCKASALSTTDASQPFHQQRAASRRSEMDARTRSHHSQADAEVEAMRGAFGRETEMRKRKVAELVDRLRTTDRNMPHTVALRKIRAAYPGLF